MSGYFNALMDPAQLGQSISNAFMMGAQHRAMSEYAKSPSMETAGGVAGLNPELGIQLQDREQRRQEAERQQQQEAQERMIVAAALNGDPEARKQLAYYNSDLYLRLDANQRKQADDLYAAIGQQAGQILALPEDQQGPALQQALQGLQAQGIDVSGFKLSGNVRQDLMAALAISGRLDEWETAQRPSYMAIPPGGTLVNTRDPAAVAQFGQQGGQQPGGLTISFEAVQQYAQTNPAGVADMLRGNAFVVQVQTPEQARQLPSGTPIILPDGSQGRVP